MKWILVAGGILVGLVLLVVLIGALLPHRHSATSSARYRQSPDEVWRILTDLQEHPSWRSGLQGMQRLPDRDGRPVWREVRSTGPMTYEITEADPPRRLVMRIADQDLPFGGTWTYRLEPDGEGTRLTITEDGEVFNPVFRFVARFIMGHHATLEAYLRDLGHRLGQDVQPIRS